LLIESCSLKKEDPGFKPLLLENGFYPGENYSEVSGDHGWHSGCGVGFLALQHVKVRLNHMKFHSDGFRFGAHGDGEEFGLVKNGSAMDSFVI
jgi:hypothetical protein